jgi:hypothetical protein
MHDWQWKTHYLEAYLTVCNFSVPGWQRISQLFFGARACDFSVRDWLWKSLLVSKLIQKVCNFFELHHFSVHDWSWKTRCGEHK